LRIKYILFAFITIIVLIAGYIGIQYYSEIPTINDINTTSLTNEKVVLTSNKDPFHVIVNSKTYYSEKKSGQWTIDLGELEGNNQIKYGGILNVGSSKIPTYKTKTLNINRTFIKPKVELNIPQYIDGKDVTVELKILNKLNIEKIYNYENLVFDKAKVDNVCQLKKDDTSIFNCKFIKPDAKDLMTKLRIVDQYDNSIALDEVKTEFVEPNNFSCNQSIIENEGKLICKGNKDAKIDYDQKSVDYKANSDIVLQESIPNGPFKKVIKLIDIHKISKEINLDANIDKDKLSIDMWSKKWSEVSAGEGYVGKDVFAKLNKSVNVKVKFFHVWKGVATDGTNDPINSRIKLLKSRINANEDTNFLSYIDYSFGTDDPSDFSRNNYYLLDFIADNGRAIKFKCNYKFMCNQL
jgi:hypothetical protein